MNDEVFYAEVADELRRAPAIPGLWTKCFAESNGEESRAKAMYLRLRAEQLKQQHSAAEAKRMANAQAQERKAESDRQIAAALKRQLEEQENAKLPVLQRKLSGEVIAVCVIAFTLLAVLVVYSLHSAR